MRINIIGAGSIGNHMANASRELGWDVTVFDISRAALSRMQDEIYPSRYGSWDSAIQLIDKADDMPVGVDLVIIGTPPDHHLPLAMKALDTKPKGILIEKPACPPSLDGAQAIFDASKASDTKVFVGYDHVVGKAARSVADLIRTDAIGEVLTVDVEFREHWAGIFKAHPWLRGPEDTYLGFTDRGGGASGEHSHALNLWQHFAHVAGAGRVVDVDGMMNYISDGEARYDQICLMNLRTENGMLGRVVQDVVTLPPSKRARLQGRQGAIEWINGYDSGADAVVLRRPNEADLVSRFPKRRKDDFIEELSYVAKHLVGEMGPSDLSLERGLDTVMVLAAAHLSERRSTRVSVDYAAGYSLRGLVASQ